MSRPEIFKWNQGEDLTIKLVYKEGDGNINAAVPLASGYSLKMDIINPSTKEVLYTINSHDPEGPVDAYLSNGENSTPNIEIVLPRAITLADGAMFTHIQSGVNSFQYDVFLRNTSSNLQAKILRGNINIERSYTLWE